MMKNKNTLINIYKIFKKLWKVYLIMKIIVNKKIFIIINALKLITITHLEKKLISSLKSI